MEAAIPDKLFFKIGEVAEISGLRPSVLRYWEGEFAVLNPKKSRSGQRLYTRADVDLICKIKRLLYTEKLTIEGARKRITAGTVKTDTKIANQEIPTEKLLTILREVTADLKELRSTL